MKAKGLFLALIFFFVSLCISAQVFKTPKEGRSMVYFIWTHIKLSHEKDLKVVKPDLGLEFSPMVQFFDGDKYLGKKNCYDNILYYECEPGTHKFWIYGGLLKYLDSELLPNQIYVVFIPLPYLGTFLGGFSGYYKELINEKFSNGVELIPINKDFDSFKYVGAKAVLCPLIEKDKHIELQESILTSKQKKKKIAELRRKSDILYNHMMKYGDPISYLSPEMYIKQDSTDSPK